MVLTLERSEFAGRRIAMLGIARTGLAAAPILMELGAQVILSDSADSSRLGNRLERAYKTGAEVRINSDPQAALFGADLVIPSPGIPMDAPVLQLARARSLPILSEIEIAYRISRAPILAVTGTNGKTTTTIWLGEMLREAGWKTYVGGNISADEVKRTLISAAAKADSEDAIVAEVSSFQLEWVEEFRPAVGILTNITPDHLNRHRSFTEYTACKERIFAAQHSGDVAVVNAVNAPSRIIGERAPGLLFWFDRGQCQKDDSACVRGGWVTVRWKGFEYALCRVDELKLPGTHNIENALAAAGAAIAFGADPDAVSKALREFGGVVHRMERVAQFGDILYVNNSMCTNVDAAVRSLEAMDRPTVIIAGGVDKNSDFAPLGAAIARGVRHLVLMGPAADTIEKAARQAGFEAVTRAASIEDAVTTATRLAQPGDAVMLSPACASFDMFADFEARGEAFRQAVQRMMMQ